MLPLRFNLKDVFMRKVFVWMWLALFLGGLISCVSSGDSSRWELVWEDDFNGTSFDTATWSKIPRANPEWARHMSDNEACYEMRDGNLVLKFYMYSRSVFTFVL